MRKLSTLADFFVICSGSSTKRTETIREAVEEELYKRGCRPWHREGLFSATWILLDYGDVIVHIFYEPIRKFYALDRLWGEAPVIEF
ncbi:MAG: ribosome silencing factor [Candidatus Omnitrophica bacterium]|nr:ribosome silencing factor [Candidatus Omnitrophota bacterium]MCM8793492.1 ribosome silencing factor [Candidatus Omnitrophota bacterium]